MSVDLSLPPPIARRLGAAGIDAPPHGWAPGPSRRRRRKRKAPRKPRRKARRKK